MNPKILLVCTNNQDEKDILQQQYSMKNQYFVVPATQTETLQSIVRSICFEYYHNSPSPLAQKIKQFTYSLTKMTFSLTLFRQIMNLSSKEHYHLKQFKRHFLQINKVIAQEGETQDPLPSQLDFSFQQEKDYLFEMANLGQIRETRLLALDQICQNDENNFKKVLTLIKTVKTQQTAGNIYNPQEKNNKQKLDNSNNLLNFFYSAQANHDDQWWKNEKKESDQSKEISKFEKKGTKLISQKSITRLVIDQFKRDLNREIELGKQIQKYEGQDLLKFNKMMKGKLMTAKMKKRGKK